LHNKIGGAEVDKAGPNFIVIEMKTTEHIIKFLFSVNFIGHGPVCFDDIEALLKLSLTILSDHIGLEFCKLTPRNVNHLLITWFTKFA